MPEENVVQMPTPLERLVMIFNAGEALCEEGRSEAEAGRAKWAAGVLMQAKALVEGRAQHESNAAFGEWSRQNFPNLKATTRAALIGLGQDPEQAKQSLETSQSWSVQLIYENEFRLSNARKTDEETVEEAQDAQQAATQATMSAHAQTQTSPKKRATPRPRKQKVVKVVKAKDPIPPKVREALKVYDAMDAAGKVIDRQTLAAEANVSTGTAGRAIIQRSLEKQVQGAPAAPNPSSFSRTMKEQYDRAVALAKKQLRLEIEVEVRAEMRKAYEEVFIPHLKSQLKQSEAIINRDKGLLSKLDYNAILRCLHPDRAQGVSETELSEALRIFTALKPVLVKADAPVGVSSSLPDTAADMMGRWRSRKK